MVGHTGLVDGVGTNPDREPLAASAAAEQEQIDAEERTSALEERESHTTHREQIADERERLADEREKAADERERAADEREWLADARERVADEREALADEREQRLNELEARLDARARSVGVSTETVPERVMEAVARGRALLATCMASLDRSESAVRRQRDRNVRQQSAVTREVAATDRDVDLNPVLADQRHDSLQRTELLRRRLLAAAADFVRAEEHIAEMHERWTTDDPDKHAFNLKVAREAREAARHVRLTTDQLDPDSAERES